VARIRLNDEKSELDNIPGPLTPESCNLDWFYNVDQDTFQYQIARKTGCSSRKRRAAIEIADGTFSNIRVKLDSYRFVL